MLVRDVSRQMALETMRKDFVANASHELRSPLTVVSGYLETMLSDEQLDPGLRAPLAEMQRQARRMNDIVERPARPVAVRRRHQGGRQRATSTSRRCWPCCARTCWRGPAIRKCGSS